MKSIAYNIIKAAFIVLFLFGCSKNYLNENPPNILSGESLYKNYDGFESGLNGLYSWVRIRTSDHAWFENVLNGVDNMCSNHVANQLYMVWGGQNNAVSSELQQIFEWLYAMINASNTMINQAENEDINWSGGKSSPEENKNRVIAEAKAIRAWAYRWLTYNWGDVPLDLEESKGSSIKTDWERTAVADVRKQMISDLSFAEQYVPVEGSLQGRLTKGAVQHYLAEMYLTINMPDSALFWADQVVGNPVYKLITTRYGEKKSQPGVPFMDMFTEGNQNRSEGNTEALWVMQFQRNIVGGGENEFRRYYAGRYDQVIVNGKKPLVITYDRGGRNKSLFSMTKWAIDNYEPQDDRASNFAIRKYFLLNDAAANAPYAADILPAGYSYGDTIKLNWDQDITNTTNLRVDWPYSRKADGTDPDNVQSDYNYNDQIYLRLADTYLLKAEAQFKLGYPDDAATTINVIRSRSNATPVTGADITLDFILDERSRELILEEERRFTLIRTHKWFERTKLYNHNGGGLISQRDTLFAFPQSVIDANLTKPMPQNPGF
jgi:hypothetical protein